MILCLDVNTWKVTEKGPHWESSPCSRQGHPRAWDGAQTALEYLQRGRFHNLSAGTRGRGMMTLKPGQRPAKSLFSIPSSKNKETNLKYIYLKPIKKREETPHFRAGDGDETRTQTLHNETLGTARPSCAVLKFKANLKSCSLVQKLERRPSRGRREKNNNQANCIFLLEIPCQEVPQDCTRGLQFQ